jgi:hypothetical protein
LYDNNAKKIENMALLKLNIGKTEFTFVFRHRFEKAETQAEQFELDFEWRCWELGLWYKRYQVISKKYILHPTKQKNNMTYMYMVGINLLICKAWIAICREDQ